MRTFDIARDDRAPVAARHALDELSDELSPTVLDDARLLVTELVTNSVRHGEGDVVRLILDVPQPDRVRCEVIDQGHGFLPIARAADSTDDGGWGLYLVEKLAETWGVREGSTHVWFELHAPEPGA
jgi:anti-sigma regulatory factor (Ser/Thr protein kinase)